MFADDHLNCSWTPQANMSCCPHSWGKRWENKLQFKIQPNIFSAIGNTPLVKLNKIPKLHNVKCEILVKCEYFNPTGSSKDRAVLRMIEDMEEKGTLRCDSTVIEASSGNTAISVATICSVKGYKCIIVCPDKSSQDKKAIIQSMGARLELLYGKEATMKGIISRAKKLACEIKNAVFLDQFNNPSNAISAYDNISEEIYYDCDGNVDVIVACVGTGGTLTGIGRKFKTIKPKTLIVGVDPVGSVRARPECLNKIEGVHSELEGFGGDNIPGCVDYNVIDLWIKSDDKNAFSVARDLARVEGILAGGSGGAAVWAALQIGRALGPCHRVVVIITDLMMNYSGGFVNDWWMEARGFKCCPNPKNFWWWDRNIMCTDPVTPHVINTDVTCHELIHIFKKYEGQKDKVQYIAILDKCTKDLLGIADRHRLEMKLINGEACENDSVEKIMLRTYPHISVENAKLGPVVKMIESEKYAVITHKTAENKRKIIAIVRPSDILEYTSKSCCC